MATLSLTIFKAKVLKDGKYKIRIPWLYESGNFTHLNL